MFLRLSLFAMFLVACSDDASPVTGSDASTDVTTDTGGGGENDATADTGSDGSVTDGGSDASDAFVYDAPADAPARCVEYCGCMTQRCPGVIPANCISACSSPNTWNIACRIDHCKLAAGDPVTHCPHAAGQNTCL